MKINGLTPPGNSGEPSKKLETPVTGPSFGNFLQDALKTGETANAKSAQAPFPIMATSPISANVTSQISNQAVKAIESTLGDLELYQNALANPNVPANRLQPMAQNLMDAKDNLVSFLPKVDDKNLKQLISQTASLIISENTRLNSPVN